MAYPAFHATIGIAVARLIPYPFISVPVAFASHFLCDLIPESPWIINGKWHKFTIVIQALLFVAVILTLIKEANVWYLVGAISALGMDLWDAVNYLRKKREFWSCHPGGRFPFDPKIWKQQPLSTIACLSLDVIIVSIILLLI